MVFETHDQVFLEGRGDLKFDNLISLIKELAIG
jgi:hypothetical protein